MKEQFIGAILVTLEQNGSELQTCKVNETVPWSILSRLQHYKPEHPTGIFKYFLVTRVVKSRLDDGYRLPYQIMGLIRCPDDIEAAIAEIFAAF
jgi:hypothetical protein